MLDQAIYAEAGILLELAINKALQRDPVAMQRLARLNGRRLRLQLTLPQFAVGVRFAAEGIQLIEDSEELRQSADCRICGAPSDLLALLMDPQLAFENRVEITGSTQLVTELRDIAHQLDMDWGGLLGDCIGDAPAQLLLNLLQQGQRGVAEASDNLLEDLDNWLHEELQVQPCRVELEGFYDDVDRLRLDVDRLRARVERLQAVQAETEVSRL